MIERPLVGILCSGLRVVKIAREPVIVLSPRVLPAFELLAPEAPVLPARLDSLDLVCRQVRNVDVQAERPSQRVRVHRPLYDRAHVREGRAEVGVLVMVEQREADRRNVVEAAFDRCAHRARVEYVDRRVRAVVDARDDQRRHLLAEHHAVESDFHAVDRRAVAGIHAQARLVGYLFQIQRPRQRNGVPHTALRLLGGDDQQASLLAQRLDQHAQSLRVHSVVVGQKYQRLVRRLLACLFHRQQR